MLKPVAPRNINIGFPELEMEDPNILQMEPSLGSGAPPSSTWRYGCFSFEMGGSFKRAP